MSSMKLRASCSWTLKDMGSFPRKSPRRSTTPFMPSCSPNSTAEGRRHRSYSRSEEHTSELQSHSDLVCRLLLEKKKTNRKINQTPHDTNLYIQATAKHR